MAGDVHDTPVSDETLRELARGIHARGLAAPALFFLEAHVPLTGMAHAAGLVASPLLSTLLGGRKFAVFMSMLDSPETLERFIRILEEEIEGAEAVTGKA